MKALRIFTGYCFLLALAGALHAAVSAPSQDLLLVLKAHQKKIPFKSRFTQIKVVKEMGIELPSQGELEVRKMGHATWKILQPAFLSVEISPEEVKILSEPKGQPRIIKKAAAQASDLQGGEWMKLLMENPEKIIEHFTVTVLKPGQFRLLPKDLKSGFDALELSFTKAAQLTEVFIQENKDDSLRIRFGAKGK